MGLSTPTCGFLVQWIKRHRKAAGPLLLRKPPIVKSRTSKLYHFTPSIVP
jgi:hypothetical protein